MQPGTQPRHLCGWLVFFGLLKPHPSRKNAEGAVVKRCMRSWYCLSLGDGMTAPLPSDEIAAAFEQVYAAAGRPPEMAVFTRPESEGRLHCEVMAYFSPSAGEIAESFDAEPCDPPVSSGLKLLAGDPQSWSVLFQEGGNQ